MKAEVVKLNPAEYGLKETEAQTIESAFMPKIVEREALRDMYEGLITGDITPNLCSEAKTLRLKLVKVRTGIAEVHKTQKAYFLAAGRYVDAWKNKETLPVEQMEGKLDEIENYYENIEKARKSKLKEERMVELAKYEADGSLMMLGEMEDNAWQIFLTGVKHQYDVKKEEERKHEEERIAAAEEEKARQAAIIKENERLRKENEALATKQKEAADAEKQKLRDEKKKAAAPDKEKLLFLAESLLSLEMPSVKTVEAVEILGNVTALIGKVVTYLTEKANGL
jgi:hypothetical protein